MRRVSLLLTRIINSPHLLHPFMQYLRLPREIFVNEKAESGQDAIGIILRRTRNAPSRTIPKLLSPTNTATRFIIFFYFFVCVIYCNLSNLVCTTETEKGQYLGAQLCIVQFNET
jgi:hypothetical protein